MRELVPISIVIRRKKVGAQVVNDYPDFNQIPEELRGGLDWCHAVDHYGIGMHYSRDGFGHGNDPHGQICATCVPQKFAESAADKFPGRVRIISEAEWEKFYDDDAHAHDPEENIDHQVLQGIAAKKALGLELTQSDRNAIDPSHPAIGIQKNHQRFWKDAKKHHGVSIVARPPTELAAPSPNPDELPSCC